MIPFNKPYITGKEVHYIYSAVATGHISGNGSFTKKCQQFFEHKWGFKKSLLTTSCTDALEMCAMLINIKPGDEIILPSYTFVSTALAFDRQGAVLKFVDCKSNHPGMDEDKIEELITSSTKAIVTVHYAGMACDMGKINAIAEKYNLYVIEDAAQAIDSYYVANDSKIPLGSLGHLACFSFHETKNIQCGEGGLLAINDFALVKRAEILWEKGTNRAEFFRGEVNKYGWVDTGSSFLPSEITAAFLWAQLEEVEKIQNKRIEIYNNYLKSLKNWALEFKVELPEIPKYATKNGHMFYLTCPSIEFRSSLINYLKSKEIHAVFHYLSLHNSEYYKNKHDGRNLPNSDRYSECLVRLPLYFELEEQQKIIDGILNFKL